MICSGITFFRENIGKLEEEDDEHMPIGFEVAFPSLLEIAREINIDVPYDSPVLKDIYAKKELKLTRYVCWANNIHLNNLFLYEYILKYICIWVQCTSLKANKRVIR